MQSDALPPGLAALAEMHERDRAAGIDPLAPVRADPTPAPVVGPPLVIPEPNWDQERLEAIRRERAARPTREPDPPLVTEDFEPRPARSTPRLNRVKRWKAELRADTGDAA
jgi:hypothetical protein